MKTPLEDLFRRRFSASEELAASAGAVFPSGVTHDARYLKPFPVFVREAVGAEKTTVEGRRLLDYWMGHGSLLLGHGHPAVVTAVQEQVARGTHFSANHELELRWAEKVIELIPSAERVRFTSSGTEATLMALRVSRLVTGRRKVLKFKDHFHGWHDTLSPTAWNPERDDEALPPGLTPGVLRDLVVIEPNDPVRLEASIVEHQPACVILEPTGAHWGQTPIREPFLQAVREITARHGVILIFDEVITGFRIHPGGAQGHFGIRPDLTTLAKILAGGLPGGALTGRTELLEALAFENRYGAKMPHQGTYNGNPLSAAAGLATLQEVGSGAACRRAIEHAAALRSRLNELFAAKRVPWCAYGDFTSVWIDPNYHGPRPEHAAFVPNQDNPSQQPVQRPRAWNHWFRAALLVHGVDWMSWGGMTSAAHTAEHVDEAVTAFGQAIDLLRESDLLTHEGFRRPEPDMVPAP